MKYKNNSFQSRLFQFTLICFLFVSQANAETKTSPKTPPAPAPASGDVAPAADSNSEWVDVNKIKEKYWARGDESELGVVQNRTYSKEHRFELGGLMGFTSSDPFLTVRNYGFSLGYHFTEYVSGHIIGWKNSVSPSSALITFQNTGGGNTANTNEPRYYLGGEVSGSILYGKLSVLGKAIIYYDLHVLGGLGIQSTETGNYFGPDLGIGQQVFLSKRISLRADYRLIYYSESIVEKVIPTKLGQVVGTRDNWTHTFSLGVSFLIGGT